MKKRIQWEAYIDPFNGNLSNFSQLMMEFERGQKDQDVNNGFEDEDEESLIETALTDRVPIFNPQTPQIIPTKMGLWTVMKHSLVSNQFDMWVMHTNFNITSEVSHTLNKAPGVEVLDILTRFRCRIGFPLQDENNYLFNNSHIKKNIEMLLEANAFSDDDIASSKLYKLRRGKGNWIAFIDLNGQMIHACNDEIPKKRKVFEKLKSMIGGEIYESKTTQ